MATNFRRTEFTTSSFQSENLVVKEGVCFVPPYLRRQKIGGPGAASRKQVTEIRIIPPVSEDGQELDVLNPAATEKMRLREILSDTFANLEVVRQLGGVKAGVRTDMITSVRAERDAASLRGGWTPYYEMRSHLVRKIRQQRDRLLLGLPIDVPQMWLDWMNAGKYEFGGLPQSNGHAYVDKDGRKHPEQYLVKCLALTIDGEAKPPTPSVFMLPPSGACAFFDQLIEPMFADRQLSADNNRFGDCFSLAHGHTLEMVKGSDNRYALRCGRELPMSAQDAKALDLPWSELVYVPTVEESIQMIAKALGSPEAVAFGLRKNEKQANSGTYERYVPPEWLQSAAGIEPELSAEEHERIMRTETQARTQATRQASASVPRETRFAPPAAGSAPESKTPPVSTGRPAQSPPAGGFRPAPQPPPPPMDPGRYDQALSRMKQTLVTDPIDVPAEGNDDADLDPNDLPM